MVYRILFFAILYISSEQIFGQITAQKQSSLTRDTAILVEAVVSDKTSPQDTASSTLGQSKTLSGISNFFALNDSIQRKAILDSAIHAQVLIETARLDSINKANERKLATADSLSKISAFDPLYGINLETLPLSQQLETQYHASLEFDKQTSFNAYHFTNWNIYSDTINPYKLEIVPYFDLEAHSYITKNNYSLFSSNWFVMDTVPATNNLTQLTPIEVFIASRNYIIHKMPQLATDTWNSLPDPPQLRGNTYLSVVNASKLDYSITDRNKIHTPEKLSKKLIKYSPWVMKGNFSLNTSQSKSTEWEKGGQDYFSLLGIITANANYSRKDVNLENFGELRLGATQQEDQGLRKNEDRIRLSSKAGLRTTNNKKWYYTVNMDFNSQLFNGYTYKDDKSTLVSSFLSPARFYLSLGMEYKNQKKFTIFLSPVTYKFTYVRDTTNINQTKYGIESDKTIKHETGGYIKSEYNVNLSKQIHLQSKLYFFSDYTKFPLKIDLDWENILNFQINHLLSASLNLHFIYDEDVKFYDAKKDEKVAKLQFKELLSIGFNYRF